MSTMTTMTDAALAHRRKGLRSLLPDEDWSAYPDLLCLEAFALVQRLSRAHARSRDLRDALSNFLITNPFPPASPAEDEDPCDEFLMEESGFGEDKNNNTMTTTKEDYTEAIGLLSKDVKMFAVERRIRAYVRALEEAIITKDTLLASAEEESGKKAMGVLAVRDGYGLSQGKAVTSAKTIQAYVKELEQPMKERSQKKVLFTEALTLVQHELPRSKAGANACAEITSYVEWLNTVVDNVTINLSSSKVKELEEELEQKIKRLEHVEEKLSDKNMTIRSEMLKSSQDQQIIALEVQVQHNAFKMKELEETRKKMRMLGTFTTECGVFAHWSEKDQKYKHEDDRSDSEDSEEHDSEDVM